MSDAARFRIRRDGEIVAEVSSEAAAWAWLHRNQPQSVDWALRYGGYRIEPITDDEDDQPEAQG